MTCFKALSLFTNKTDKKQPKQFLEVLAGSLKSIADQKNEIIKLRSDLEELKNYVEQIKLSWWQKLLRKKE